MKLSTSSYVHETTTAPTSSLKVTKPKRTQISTKINVLKKELKSMNIANEKYSKRLKKAMNLSENTTFLKAIKSFTSIATIFTVLQFRECGKHKMGRRFTPDEKVMALHFF
ncbi:unnamed protein product [Parnassius apollo]|uniref:(apollo) hypothetical protein n=1 Tax=Parnassius apollo TaxID=110799 RepID=A0A8S3WTZ6_PARAO|nr:unnamed protein product [Parnassius apollo]